MKLLIHLRERRAEIERIVGELHGCNIRVFGSVARGEETESSDIDLLIDMEGEDKEHMRIRIACISGELEQVLKRPVHVHVERLLRPSQRKNIVNEAVPL